MVIKIPQSDMLNFIADAYNPVPKIHLSKSEWLSLGLRYPSHWDAFEKQTQKHYR